VQATFLSISVFVIAAVSAPVLRACRAISAHEPIRAIVTKPIRVAPERTLLTEQP